MKKKLIKTKSLEKKPIHFAIHIDDIDRAKQFYSTIFGWSYNTIETEGFIQIKNRENTLPIGMFQSRSKKSNSLDNIECYIEVKDIDNTILTVIYNKGTIIMPKTEIPNLGLITKFLDTEDNIVSVIQYYKN